MIGYPGDLIGQFVSLGCDLRYSESLIEPSESLVGLSEPLSGSLILDRVL
jgi:hypothetical protein